jgi:polysaccharide biosynthesis protein PslH
VRLLVLSSWWPEPADNGSRLRISHLLRELASRHELHLVAQAQEPVTPEQLERLRRICASVRVVQERRWQLSRTDVIASLWHNVPASVRASWNPQLDAVVQEHASAVQPDLVLALQLGVAPYAARIAGVPRVLEEVEVLRFYDAFAKERRPRQRARAYLTWYKQRGYLERLLRSFDACSVVSEQEARLLARVAPAGMPIGVVPNGADVQGAAQVRSDPVPDTLVYPGALSFDANFDAVAYFLAEIFPLIKARRPAARFRITGKTDPARLAALPRHEGVEFTGYVPDVRQVVADAWCEVVPLRLGGGTRLKVLEALALGTPVVATSKGIEGLALTHGRDVLVADTPDAFAAATVRLLEDANLREQLAAAGRSVVRSRYDWPVIAQRLNDLIQQTAERAVSRKVHRHAPDRHAPDRA